MAKNTGTAPRIANAYQENIGIRLRSDSELARQIEHAPSKGRIHEAMVEGALRQLIPERYAFGTGFIVNRNGESSRQIDIVVHDRLTNSPMRLAGDIWVFPIESVFATIEVKTTLTSKDVKAWCNSVAEIRRMASLKRTISYGSRQVGEGKYVVDPRPKDGGLPPRSFLFAFSAGWRSLKSFQDACSSAAKAAPDSMNHGVFILSKSWLAYRVAHSKSTKAVQLSQETALQHFVLSIRSNVESFGVAPADMASYMR